MKFKHIKSKKKLGIIKDKIEFDVDLVKDGLFVFGSQDSKKKDFLLDIAYKVIDSKMKLIYLTDSNYIVDNLFSYFKDNENKDNINIENINKVFKNKKYEYKHDINIIKMDQDYSFPLQKKGKQYFPDLLNNIAQLDDTILIIDEVLNQNIYKKDLTKSINILHKSNIGLVISDYYVRAYNELYSITPHHIFFYLYDSPYELKNHPVIVDEVASFKDFEKIELNYIYNLFSYYNATNKSIVFNIK